MIPHPVKIKCEVKLLCFSVAGIDDIKSVLKEGYLLGTKEIPIKIRVISSPLYEISTETLKKNEALVLLNEVITKIEQSIKMKSGSFILHLKPEIVGEQGVKDIEEQIKEMKKKEEEEEEDEDHDEGIRANIEGIDNIEDMKSDLDI
jgi:translation initiation factor 2 subunit 1